MFYSLCVVNCAVSYGSCSQSDEHAGVNQAVPSSSAGDLHSPGSLYPVFHDPGLNDQRDAQMSAAGLGSGELQSCSDTDYQGEIWNYY